MARTTSGSPPPARVRGSTLRSRLLLRLIVLLIIMGGFTLLTAGGAPAGLPPLTRTVLGILLFAAGISLLLSILGLVQHQLLEPLSQIREWAGRLLGGQ